MLDGIDETKKECNPSTVLTFVSWHNQTAVYKGDDLIYFGEYPGGCWLLLKALGYTVSHGTVDDIPTHDIPCEYSTDDNGRWLPPPSLQILIRQQASMNERLRREEIAELKQRLAFLESGSDY